jgi:alkylhydroperoxidase/carboxymuconolactone decarboxylase family protein YurZ
MAHNRFALRNAQEDSMTTPITPEETLRVLAQGDAPVLETLAQMHLDTLERSGLDPRTYFLVRFATLVAMDAAPVSYLLAFGTAEDAGATVDDMRGTLAAVAPIVGSARVVSAAGKTIRALGLAEAIEESE